MAILISDEILQAQQVDEQVLRVEIACVLYDREILSLGLASKMARLDRISFQKALADRQIDIKYTTKDLTDDLNSLRKLKLYGSHQ